MPDDSDHPDALRNGSIDLDIGLAEPPAPDVKVEELYSERYVALVSAQSQLGRARRLTVEQLCRYPHKMCIRDRGYAGKRDKNAEDD